MLGDLDQPRQDGLGIDLKDAGYGTNAHALSQRAHRPHQQVDRHTLAMPRGAMGLLDRAITARAMPLPPGATTGMPIGTDMAEPDPAPIGTVRMRAAMPRGVHLARPSPRRHDTGWRATGWLGYGLVGLRTGGTAGLAGEAR